MPPHLKPKLMIEDTPKLPVEPTDEEGEDAEIEREEELLQSPLLELEISKPDLHISIRIAGEEIEKAKQVALELFEKISKGRRT
ncbi:hypothetical protein [Thermococcus paralvinellae]|uniref:hypothetical protein n=1 Tax=Thermococcus paralvinellae TaxID=582419 RepID=UPI000AE23017|nr:hypothetical protein [Thermococcus paralvinellae]